LSRKYRKEEGKGEFTTFTKMNILRAKKESDKENVTGNLPLPALKFKNYFIIIDFYKKW
jgi:hypothetical protein